MADTSLAPLSTALSRALAGVPGGLRALLEGKLPAGDPRVWFTRAPRLVGKDSVPLGEAERASLGCAPPQLAADELVRIVLLVRAAEALPANELQALLDGAYRHGENRERVAVLRALPLLPAAERFVELAADACRTNVVPVFEAIACENPYPARHFSAASFRQLVMKAIFLEVSIQRIHGLSQRVDGELARMAADFSAERRAAGRSVPDDATWLTTRTFP